MRLLIGLGNGRKKERLFAAPFIVRRHPCFFLGFLLFCWPGDVVHGVLVLRVLLECGLGLAERGGGFVLLLLVEVGVGVGSGVAVASAE